MPLKKINPTETNAWQRLRQHFAEMQFVTMQEMFANDEKRVEKFHIEWDKFLIDYSKNRINETTLELLLELAKEVALKEAIESQFNGEKINETENRAVLHTALRAKIDDHIVVDGKNIAEDVQFVKNKIKEFSSNIISGKLKGFSGERITDVVNIGIGGSDLGPAMVIDALQFYKNNLNLHFVSNIDGDHLFEILKPLNPETTLFIIVSKTFTTQETLSNAQKIREWFLKSAATVDIEKHFVAVTAAFQKAIDFGIAEENIFPMWDWVGGRFSLWSAVGFSISLSIGYDNFEKLLEGAYKMDIHFKNESFDKNIPVILALISIWYNNFYGAESEAIIPYSQYLQKLAPYLQQSVMESNGKNVGRDGYPVNYQTGNIIWGEPGTNSQHAFFQLIHQGTKLIPADFIGFKKSLNGNVSHHNKLMSNFFAQTEALLKGKTALQAKSEFDKKVTEAEISFLVPFKTFEGNKPTNTILIDSLTPETLGSLIAMYEHKIFVQGVIWNIFSYDQWGVELGKQLANSILNELEKEDFKTHDASTNFLISKYLN
ncbi:MAG: glucose-6-phosphate isomerase [Limnohabitans sp.]|nr:glucose-6-phosphate isomerase [Limnohabitans sp.]